MSNLPKDWELKTLGELVFILTDYTANGSFASLKENVTYFNEPNFAALVRTTDLKKKEFKPERFTDKRGYEFLKKSALYGGEILMANVGSIGEVYIVPEVDFPMTLAPNMYLIKYNDNLINTYAYYFMNSSIFINQLLSKIASTTLQAVNKANFKSIKIPLPPLEEQKKIADILSTVDKKLENLKEKKQSFEELKKGLMQKLLTEGIGHTEFKNSELGRIPESWEIDKLENLTTKIGDGLHGTPKYVEQSDYYFINGNNLNGESIEINKNTKCVNEEEYIKNKKILDNTTILLSINGTIGSLAYYNNENVMLGKSVAYMNVNSKILKQFLFYLLKSSKILEYFILELTGTTIKNLSLKTIRNTKIPLPPLEEQKQIAEILSTVDNKLENLKEKKQSFEELKKGLMQKLLTGEVRV